MFRSASTTSAPRASKTPRATKTPWASRAPARASSAPRNLRALTAPLLGFWELSVLHGTTELLWAPELELPDIDRLPEIIEVTGNSELPVLPKLQGLSGLSTPGNFKAAGLLGLPSLYGLPASPEFLGLLGL